MKNRFFYLIAAIVTLGMSSCYTTHDVPYNNYSFSLLDEQGNVKDSTGSLTYADSLLTASFEIGEKDINFVMKNQTANTMKVLWDESLFIRGGSPGKVMHGGVKYTDRNQSMPPSVIPAGTTFDDVIVPSDNVYWRDGYYSQYGSSPGGWEKRDLFPASSTYKGDKFGVYMPVSVGGNTKEYNFNFRVDETRTQYKQVRTMDVAKTTWLTLGLTVVPLILLLSAY